MTSRQGRSCSQLIGLSVFICVLLVLQASPAGADPAEAPRRDAEAPHAANMNILDLPGPASARVHGVRPHKRGVRPGAQARPIIATVRYPESEVHPTQLLVRYKPRTKSTTRRAANRAAGVLRTLKSYDIVQDLHLVEVPAGKTAEVLRALRANPNVEYAELDQKLVFFSEPDDPLFPEQWGLLNTGQTIQGVQGTPGADIRAVEAWQLLASHGLPNGSPTSRIAVIDSGVDFEHPDLEANMWVNLGETGIDEFGEDKRSNGVDDDGNLYIDDVHGQYFADGVAYGYPMYKGESGHGTHVAGIIGAVTNNGVGVAGVNWQCQIVALRVQWVSDVIYALKYCIDEGIRISNNSWGVPTFSRFMRDAIESAGADGHIFVAAAGNGWALVGQDTDDFWRSYPACYDLENILSVAATDNNDGLAYFSNFGRKSVDLGAPGVAVVSTVLEEAYAYADGTSMAAPQVAAVAGMMWGLFPALTAEQVRARILMTTRPVASLEGITVTGGVVHARRAVADCNDNGILDFDDLAPGGTSTDCNDNAVPDECEPDCNLNDVADGCDISLMTSTDCNEDGVPDECEPDCNGNGIADDCDLVAHFSESTELTPIEGGVELSFPVEPAPRPVGDVTLTIEASADLGALDEYIDFMVGFDRALPDGSYYADFYSGRLFETTGLDCAPTIAEVVIPWNVFRFMIGTFGDDFINFAFMPSSTVGGAECVGGSTMNVTVTYAVHDEVGDCNHNQVPDECEPGGLEDCNSNGSMDLCDIFENPSDDCNGNAVPDECDIATGTSEDCTDNGEPDECERDCDENGLADSCDIDADGSLDLDFDGVLDTCAVGFTLVPLSASGEYAITGREITVLPGARVNFEVRISGWDPDMDGTPRLAVYQATMDMDGLTSGAAGSLNPAQFPCEFHAECPGGQCLSAGYCSLSSAMPIDRAHPDYVFLGVTSTSASAEYTLAAGATTFYTPDAAIETASPRYAASLTLDVSSDADGTFEVGFIDSPNYTFFTASDGGYIPVPGWNAATVVVADCNHNGVLDGTDIASGTSADCNGNGNGIPDECEPDCNGNAIADSCDLVTGSSEDCNGNAIPDECEDTSADCNGNSVWDGCDIGTGTSEDCNGNDVPDECDIVDQEESDCNVNGVPDSCDVDSGSSADCNGNGVPDACDIDPLDPDGDSLVSADCNGNGVPDECEPDCDGNGVPDACDIDPLDPDGDGFVSDDCNGNGVPDACDIDPTDPDGNSFVSDDCNGNGVPDECDVDSGFSADCNGNGTPDECDIASGFSADCNGNGTPDECDIASGFSADCNGNGVPDECDIAGGFSEDCDANGVPDECDPQGDCNVNGIQDTCDIAAGTSQDCNENVVPDECDVDPTDPDGDGVVSDDCSGNNVPDECEPDCNENGIQDTCDIAAGTSNDCNINLRPDECDFESGFSDDCNGNGLPDDCDIASGANDDCNANGVPDSCEIDSDGDGQVIYSNTKGQALFRLGAGSRVADDLTTKLMGSCSLKTARVRVTGGVEGGGGSFLAEVGLYDACPDSSVGGTLIPGSLALFSGLDDDASLFHDLTLDFSDRGICGDGSECEVSQQNCTDQSVCEENPLEIPPTVWVRIRFNTSDAAILIGEAPTIGWSTDGYDGPFGTCTNWLGGWPTHPHASFWVELTAPVDCEMRSRAYSAADPNRPPFLPTDIALPDVGTSQTRLGDDIRLSVDDCIVDAFELGIEGSGSYQMSVDLRWPTILDVIPETVQTFSGNGGGGVEVARFTIPPEIELSIDALDQPIYITWAATQGNAGVLEVDLARVGESGPEFYALNTDPSNPGTWNTLFQPDGSPAVFYTAVYCRGDALLGGGCNWCGIPDECSIDCGPPGGPCDLEGCGESEDCNSNGIPDNCDIDSEFSEDCNENGIPDECDPGADCNTNGVLDECDLDSGFSEDCNENGIPDECGPQEDCNTNGVLDVCDLFAGTSEDCNGNQVPDECDASLCVCYPIEAPTPESNGACVVDTDCDAGVSCIDGTCYAEKGRYISFEPNNAGEMVAFFIGDPPQLGTCTGTGTACETAADCPKSCSISGAPCQRSCLPGAGMCLSGLCFGASPGSGAWVGEPDALDTAVLVDEPVYRVWTEPVIHVGDCAIVPSSSYDVQAMHLGCDPADGNYYSSAVTLTTALWGDIVGFFNVTAWTPPDGAIDLFDQQAILQAQTSQSTAPPMTWADLEGEVPNRVINANDTFQQSQAAQGNPYPFSDPGQCP